MPAAGGRPPEPRPGAPRAGGPQAGRGQSQPNPYQSPQPGGYQPSQQNYAPQTGPISGGPAGSPPRNQQPYQPQPAPAGPERSPEPFEEAAFADDASKGDWSGSQTTAIGKLGYAAKEPRQRSDFQKKRSRARKSSPIPKIIAAVVALGLVGGAVWWYLNRPEEVDPAEDPMAGLTYGASEEPCALADTAPLEGLVDGTEPEATATAEEKSRGWVQSCSLTFGETDRALALLEFEGTVFDSDSKAGVNFELGTKQIEEMGANWTPVDPAPAIGAQSAAVARVVDDGTSNYQLHIQDANVYLVVRLSVSDAGLDQQGLTDLTLELANSYLANWDEAS